MSEEKKEPEAPKEEQKAPAEVKKPELKDEVLEELKKKFPDAVSGSVSRERRVMITVKKEKLMDVCRHLKETRRVDHLSSVSGADYEDRFEAVYHLCSASFGKIYALKVQLPKEDPKVKSVTSLWGSANWHEREAYDLYGITFEGHPNLTRILNPDDFEGFPFRKDWKLVANPWYEDRYPAGESKGEEGE